MKGTTRIYEDGEVVVEVTDREGQQCSEVLRLKEKVGTVVSDEELPDCSGTQHEYTT